MKQMKIIVVALIVMFMHVAYAGVDGMQVPASLNSQQKQAVHLVKNYYASFNRKDLPSFLSGLDAHVTHDINQGNTEIGIEKFKKFMEAEFASDKEFLTQIVILVSDNGKLAVGRWVDKGTVNNKKYMISGANFFEINNDKITRVTTYYNEKDYEKQVG